MSISKLLFIDSRLSKKLRVAEKPGLLRSLAAFWAHSGDSWFWLAGLLILGLVGSPPWKLRAFILIAAILGTATFVLALKFTFRRRRPEGEWGQIYRKSDPHSFPSGHAARGMMLAVIAVGWGPPWFAWLLAVWGPLVGLARIAMGVHYVSDVVAGWLIGAATALLTLALTAPFIL